MSAVFDFKDIGQRLVNIETKQPTKQLTKQPTKRPVIDHSEWTEPLSAWTEWPGIDHIGPYKAYKAALQRWHDSH